MTFLGRDAEGLAIYQMDAAPVATNMTAYDPDRIYSIRRPTEAEMPGYTGGRGVVDFSRVRR